MVSPCRVSSSPCMLGSPSLEKGRWENMAVKSGLAGVVVQDSPSVALLMVFEVVEALGTLGGTGLVAVVCGEMANSGFLICSSCFALLLSLLMNHSITFLSSVATVSFIPSSILANLKSTASLKNTSQIILLSIETLKSFSSFKTKFLRTATLACSCTHSHCCKKKNSNL